MVIPRAIARSLIRQNVISKKVEEHRIRRARFRRASGVLIGTVVAESRSEENLCERSLALGEAEKLRPASRQDFLPRRTPWEIEEKPFLAGIS